jgi:hypothetical protein
MSLSRAEAHGGFTATMLRLLPEAAFLWVYQRLRRTAHYPPVNAPNPIQPEGLRGFSEGQRSAGGKLGQESSSSPD